MEERRGHWIVEVNATDGYGKPFRAKAVIDSGSAADVIDPRLVNKKRLPYRPKERPVIVRIGEGTPYEYNNGTIIDEATLLIKVDGDEQKVTFDVIPVYSYDIILGKPWLKKYNPMIDWERNQLDFGRKHPAQTAQQDDVLSSSHKEEESSPLWIRFHETEDPNDLGYETGDDPEAVVCHGSPQKTTSKQDQDGQDDSMGDLTKVPKEYHEFSIFRKKIPRLPDYGPYDHEIKLKEGAQLRFFKPYHLNPAQDEALQEYIRENLKNGFIRELQSPTGYPVLFVPRKGDGKLRIVVDYRTLNDDTIKNRYPLPLIAEMRERIAKA